MEFVDVQVKIRDVIANSTKVRLCQRKRKGKNVSTLIWPLVAKKTEKEKKN